MKKFSMLFLILVLFLNPLESKAFTLVQDSLFGGMSIDPSELDGILDTIKLNKKANKKIRNKKKKLPTTITTVTAHMKDPSSIQFEVDTSEVIVKSAGDIQAPISNSAFLNAIETALDVWEGVEIVDIMFAPLKFSSGQPDPQDGRNVISARTKVQEGVPGDAAVFTFIQYAKTPNVTFMGKLITVEPGTILDADIFFDPANDSCLALFTSSDEYTELGIDQYTIVEGGIDNESPTLADCADAGDISLADISDLTVQAESLALGLENSGIATSLRANTATPPKMLPRTDDKIGLANLYPQMDVAIQRGTIFGKITLDTTGKPVVGAHVVIQDKTTGEPIASNLTAIDGTYSIMAIPPGSYIVYAEPVDGHIRKAALELSSFAQFSQINFTTVATDKDVIVAAKKATEANITVREIAGASFTIQAKGAEFTENDYEARGGGFFVPVIIMPGQTLTDQRFWGSNISADFVGVSFSGTGLTATNVRSEPIQITDRVECAECEEPEDPTLPPCNRDPRCPATHELTKEGDIIPGIVMDITCDENATTGPRSLIITGDQLDPEHPSFGLRDQITGGVFIRN